MMTHACSKSASVATGARVCVRLCLEEKGGSTHPKVHDVVRVDQIGRVPARWLRGGEGRGGKRCQSHIYEI